MEVTFTVSKWDEKPIDDNKKDFPINIAHVEYDIDGELKGKAFVEYLLYYLDSNINDGHLATAKISGFLHFEGIYKGQQGTFTALEQGIFDKGNLDSPGTIIKATGNLENLRGSYNYQFTGQTSKLIFEFEFQQNTL
ncbi:DUF3224 domain-containing protein [Bacillus thuringiensis]|uniref:DUF3224 domain-containing protein n=1 Tax=Bacillus thuringiensis TaxID=1428 RepID=UPI000BFAAA5A|nr:DUF3224 domain-containing protein [Bacillus thuringiensis]PFA84143.1 PbsX family transcriptional regulator [Bacillus thuringiensis]